MYHYETKVLPISQGKMKPRVAVLFFCFFLGRDKIFIQSGSTLANNGINHARWSEQMLWEHFIQATVNASNQTEARLKLSDYIWAKLYFPTPRRAPLGHSTTVKFIKWLSRADWSPSSLGELLRSSIKQGGSGHQDSSSSTSQSIATMTSSSAPHEISIKSKHLAKDKMIWWCELGRMGKTLTLIKPPARPENTPPRHLRAYSCKIT